MNEKTDTVAIVSGGLDSVTMLYWLVDQGLHPHALSFNYGQRHAKEIDFAFNAARKLGLHHDTVDLSSITKLISHHSALTGPTPVPEGHYAEDNMAITVVPNRNMVMLSIATAAAVSQGCEYVAAGMHAGDHAQYPDCRPGFVHSMTSALRIANEGFILPDFRILTPWINKTKNDIAEIAYALGVPPHYTWSCYKGGANHCGRCGTCVERLEAIHSVEDAPEDWDLTTYEDPDYWRIAVENFKAAR